MTTIRRVAEEAGVSTSTVSRVLSDHPDVSAETRSKVLAAIKKLNYHPSVLARALKGGRPRIIGLMAAGVGNPFYPELLDGVEKAAAARGYSTFLCTTDDDPELTKARLWLLHAYQVDGIIHASARIDDPAAEIAERPPLVYMNRVADDSGAPSVTVDNYGGAMMATQHLLEHGRCRLMHLAGPEWASTARDRAAGFHAAIAQADKQPTSVRVVEVGFWGPLAREIIHEMLDERPLPDAIVGVHDSITISAMEEIVARGIRIPDDIAVIGFDDSYLSASPFIRLSTVAYDKREIGTLATDMLLDRIEGKPREWPEHVVLEPRLVIRGSCC